MSAESQHPEPVVVAVAHGGVLILTINRPLKYNAFNRDVLTSLSDGFRNLPAYIGAVIVTGEGKAFAAGADISEYYQATADQLQDFPDLANDTCRVIRDCPVPTIAAVNGVALGGGFEVALSCDLIYASSAAQFGLPELSLGLIPGWGGTQTLGERIGRFRALEAILTGRRFSADEALALGIVNRVFEPEEMFAEARAFADRLAALPHEAVLGAKRAVSAAAPYRSDAAKVEQAELHTLFASADGREGVQAFVDKRPPVWAPLPARR